MTGPLPAPATRDRLTVTAFLAGFLHLILILGITFAPPLAENGEVPTLEVLLVGGAMPESPDNERASYLAERTQQGSGNSPQDRTRRPAPGAGSPAMPGLPDGASAPSAPQTDAGGKGRLLAGRAGRPRFVADEADEASSRIPPPRESLTAATSPFAGSDQDGELELKGAPRRELVVTPSTQTSDVAVYLDTWKRRIEQIGTLNFPNAARRSRLSGNPVVEVVLASGGGLVRADVRRSSGHGELDRAALDILRLAAPFEPFPEVLAARHDVLRFAYEWQFVGGRLAGSAVEVPMPATD